MGCNSSVARPQPPALGTVCQESLLPEVGHDRLLTWSFAEASDTVDADVAEGPCLAKASPRFADKVRLDAILTPRTLTLADRGITDVSFLEGRATPSTGMGSSNTQSSAHAATPLFATVEEDWVLLEPCHTVPCTDEAVPSPVPQSRAPSRARGGEPAVPSPAVPRPVARAPPRPEAPEAPPEAPEAGAPSPRTVPSSAAEADLDHYQDSMRLLDLDLKRTYASDPDVQSRRTVLREMLLRRLAEDPEVGYCQGLSFWAAPFALACESKQEAYSRFLSLTQRMRALWLPGLPLLRDGSELFAAAADDRPWFKHMEEHGVHTSMYLPQVWVALFSQWLPMSSLLQCLPFLEHRGFEGVISLTLAVLEEVSPELMRLTCIEDILPLLSSIRQCSCTHKVTALIEAAGLWIPSVTRTAEHAATGIKAL